MEAESTMYKESRQRSLLKALSWRIIATVTTTSIAYAITGKIEAAVMIASIEFVLKFAIYYGHERLWQWLPSGTIGLGGVVQRQPRATIDRRLYDPLEICK